MAYAAPTRSRFAEPNHPVGRCVNPLRGSSTPLRPETAGAVRPVTRSAARKVVVCQRLSGAWSTTRSPRCPRP